MDCIFCKVAQQKIPTKLIYQDEDIVAFDDLSPQAPVHKLIIPRQHIASLNELQTEQLPLIGKMTCVAKELAQELGLAEEGYRLVMNCNTAGGQTVFHIHMHLIAGREMKWPPG